jgi:Leucine-rich repeat (LRR) protein
LEILFIEHNQLKVVPKEIAGCINLRELHLGFNQLTHIPIEIGFLVNLEKLYLQRNDLQELPEVYFALISDFL